MQAFFKIEFAFLMIRTLKFSCRLTNQLFKYTEIYIAAVISKKKKLLGIYKSIT